MKKIPILLSAIFISQFVNAQNVGIGTAEPLNKLQVVGNFLVNTPSTNTATAPTAAQTKTMINASNIVFQQIDSTGIIYDPGGATGNYLPNLNATAGIISTSCVGIEIIFTSLQLGIGDSLIIKDASSATITLFAVGNGYNTTGKFIFNASGLNIVFKSNADANVGSGFSLLFRRLFDASSSLPDANAITTRAFFFNTKTGALKSGSINNATTGNFSNALGYEVTASGIYSTAMGYYSSALSEGSTAFGYASEAKNKGSTAFGSFCKAWGDFSVAGGDFSLAEGYASTAFGESSRATGVYSTALGEFTDASGSGSTSMGSFTNAEGRYSSTLGEHTTSKGYAGTVVGMYNFPVVATPQTSVSTSTPLFIVGNGNNQNELSNALVVLKSGNVGIGNLLPPVTKLQVDGGTDASLANNSGYLLIGDYLNSNLVFDNNEIIARNNGADATLFLQNSGGALVVGGTASKPGGGSWSATSDARLKQHTKPYSDGLQQLLKINPVYFQYNHFTSYDTSKQHIGVIAQELKEIAPYMVGSFTQNNNEYLNVDNSSMTYMLINAVKEQQKTMEELNKKNNDLKIRLEKLEAILLETNNP